MINVPFFATMGRLIVAIISFIMMFLGNWITASILIFVAVIMDILDGRLARRLKQVTKQGVYLDIMVDKIVIISTFLIIGFKINPIFFYFGLLILLREYTMDTIRTIAASEKIVISADKFSKIKGVFYMTAMVGMVINFGTLNIEIIQSTMVVLAICGLILAYISLVRIFLKHKKILMK